MSKVATKWKTRNGSDTVAPDNSGFSLLLETDFNLLLEDGGELLLESSSVTPKPHTEWSTPSKNRTAWAQRDGSSTVVVSTADTRVTPTGDTRITAQGDTRVTGVATFTKKKPTLWSDA